MQIILRTEDKIRFQNFDSSVFADVKSNTGQYGIEISFYQINNKLRLIEKDRICKMFIIPNNYPLDDYDFGWWKDGKIIWQSF